MTGDATSASHDATTASRDDEPRAAVACPHCDAEVVVPVPNRAVDPTPSPYLAAFGDHTETRCPTGHRFWVYYC